MKRIQIDSSWIIKYEQYLQRCSQENSKIDQGMNFEGKKQPKVLESQNVVVANLANVIRTRKPIKSIYKRPI